MKKIVGNPTMAFLITGALFLVVADQLSFSAGYSIAMGFLGLSALAEGWRLIVYRQGSLVQVQSGNARYANLAAQLWGILLVAGACLLFLLGIAGLLVKGGAAAFWTDFLNKPYGWGMLLLGAGGGLGIYGTIRLLENIAWKPKDFSSRMYIFEELIKGGFSIFIGLVLLGIGAGLLLAPQLLRSLASAIGQAFLHFLSGS